MVTVTTPAGGATKTFGATLEHPNYNASIVITELSTSGFVTASEIPLPAGSTVLVDLPRLGQTAAVIMKHDAGRSHCTFADALDA